MMNCSALENMGVGVFSLAHDHLGAMRDRAIPHHGQFETRGMLISTQAPPSSRGSPRRRSMLAMISAFDLRGRGPVGRLFLSQIFTRGEGGKSVIRQGVGGLHEPVDAIGGMGASGAHELLAQLTDNHNGGGLILLL